MTHEVGHERYIRPCIELTRQALLTNDTPVGSLIIVVIKSSRKESRLYVASVMSPRTQRFRRFARPSFN